MASKTLKTTTKKTQFNINLKLFRRRNILWAFGVLLLLVLVGWAIVYQHRQDLAIQTQQQRFNTMQSVQDNFESNVKNLLGSALVSVKDERSCYRTEQGPYDNGKLWCGISVVGDTKELPSTVAGGQGAWETINRIDAVAHNEVAKTGVAYKSSGFSPGNPAPGDSLTYDDFFYLYGTKEQNNGTEMRCDITGDKYSDTVIAKDPQGKPKQLHFVFSCNQRSSKLFFQFQSS